MLGMTPLVSKSERQLIGTRCSSLWRLRAIRSLAVSMSRLVSPSFSRRTRSFCPPEPCPSPSAIDPIDSLPLVLVNFPPGKDHLSLVSMKCQLPACDYNREDSSVLVSVAPLLCCTFALRSRSACLSEQFWYVCGRTEVENRHVQELSPGVAILLHCSIIDVKEDVAIPVENPHGMRTTSEWQPPQFGHWRGSRFQ